MLSIQNFALVTYGVHKLALLASVGTLAVRLANSQLDGAMTVCPNTFYIVLGTTLI